MEFVLAGTGGRVGGMCLQSPPPPPPPDPSPSPSLNYTREEEAVLGWGGGAKIEGMLPS